MVLKRRTGKRQTVETLTPTYTFRAGKIGEGSFQVWFELIGSAKRSKTTSLRIAYDNNVPTAYVTAPAHGARWGDDIRVSGVAQTAAKSCWTSPASEASKPYP